MSDEKNPVDKAMELLVFAPVGLALSARDLLPQLIEKGRQQVTGQVTMAKMIGQFAVQQGQVEAGKALGKAREQAIGTLETIARGPGGGAPQRPEPRATASPTAPTPSATTTPVEAAPAPKAAAAPAPAPAPAPTEAPPEPATPAPPVGDLAIPDYESLAASQVVPRLSGLSGDELEAVRAYEAANRGRKTILNKVAQLQGA